ncbi:hypothetical protein JMG10_14575 [Nostoc ellipsosporum NOK]|nr:hypothetical protein [Nostoc ellipsosporum NOK]
MSFEVEFIYEKREFKSANDLKFFFVSEGYEDVIKAIQYAFVDVVENREVINLGFGDYDMDTDTVSDSVTTNNNDGRKVFNTVLSTIPIFFKYYPDKMIVVQGSDSDEDFRERCNQNCEKKCGEGCRKFNQRIRIYRTYVELHWDVLNKEYQFFGGFVSENGVAVKEPYVKGRNYTSVLLIKRN